MEDDGGYAGKVMAERARLLAVVVGSKRQPPSRSFSSPAPSHPIPVSLPAKSAQLESGDKAPEKVALLDQS